MACCNTETEEYTCVPATEVLVFGDGTEMTLGQVLVCKKRQCPVILEEKLCKGVRVEHCHNINRVSCKMNQSRIPNNYRLTYLNGATEFRASDYLCRTGGCCVSARSRKVGRTQLHQSAITEIETKAEQVNYNYSTHFYWKQNKTLENTDD